MEFAQWPVAHKTRLTLKPDGLISPAKWARLLDFSFALVLVAGRSYGGLSIDDMKMAKATVILNYSGGIDYPLSSPN
jgi:hypothetical protein